MNAFQNNIYKKVLNIPTSEQSNCPTGRLSNTTTNKYSTTS